MHPQRAVSRGSAGSATTSPRTGPSEPTNPTTSPIATSTATSPTTGSPPNRSSRTVVKTAPCRSNHSDTCMTAPNAAAPRIGVVTEIGAYRSHAQSSSASAGVRVAGVGVVATSALRGQQHPAQLLGVRPADRVERQLAVLAGGLLAGADLDLGQPERAQQRVRGQVDGAHPLPRDRPQLVQHPRVPQLDPLVGDPVGGVPPAQTGRRARRAPVSTTIPPTAMPAPGRPGGRCEMPITIGMRDRPTRSGHRQRGDRDRARMQPLPPPASCTARSRRVPAVGLRGLGEPCRRGRRPPRGQAPGS